MHSQTSRFRLTAGRTSLVAAALLAIAADPVAVHAQVSLRGQRGDGGRGAAPMPVPIGKQKAGAQVEKHDAQKVYDAEKANLLFEDNLADSDARDTVRQQCFAKIYQFKLSPSKGELYVIDMVSAELDSYLRLEDDMGMQLAEDDDGGGQQNARIRFSPKKSGIYRIIATSFDPNKTGSYALTVKRAMAEPWDSPREGELRLELLRRVKVDQEARIKLVDAVERKGGAVDKKLADAVRQADQENTARLIEIVKKYGWPTNSLVGKDGSHAAWLLVQHADRDTKFQRMCLDLMAKQPKEEVSQSDLAYLTDRVLLAEGKKQVFGTQFTVSDKGKLEPLPLEDETNVDRRRAEVGLPSLAEYVKVLESMRNPSPKK